MVRIDIRITKIVFSIAMFALAALAGYGLSYADKSDMSTAVFFVG
jgi:hypothetical protein